jgi:hypothetical protein
LRNLEPWSISVAASAAGSGERAALLALQKKHEGMNTKSLLCTALVATGVTTAIAANVVGYYNVVAPAGKKLMIGNQLHTTNDTLVGVLASPGPGANFFKFDGTFTDYVFDDVDLVWNGNTSLAPGEGGFFLSAINTTLTFVGTVLKGSLTNTLPIGIKVLRTSIVPQAGGVTSDLKLPAEPGDNLFSYTSNYVNYFYDDIDLVWTPREPTNKIGESFFYIKGVSSVSNLWIRNFTVQ